MKIVLEIAVLYILCVVIMFVFQRSFMYFPDTQKFTSFDSVESIRVTAFDGVEISSWYVSAQSASKNKVIVFFHGNAGQAVHRFPKALPYVEAGYDVFLAEYRGYGGNDGKPHEAGLYQDARAQIDYLKQVKGVDERDIVLYGESLGSAIAVEMATENPNAHALVLETPFSSMVDVASKHYFFLPVQFLLLDRYMSIDKVASLHMPVLIGHGKQDETVPYSSAVKLYERIQMQKKFVSYDLGGHNNLYDFGLADDVLAFLDSI